jgi:hypothetical protein
MAFAFRGFAYAQIQRGKIHAQLLLHMSLESTSSHAHERLTHPLFFPLPMPKAFLLLPLLSLSLAAFGQRTELSLHLNSGMASFLSDAPNDQSLLVRYDWMYQTTYYANNPYGGRLVLSYGLAAQATRVTRGGVIFGLQTGYEVLRSRVSIRDYFAPRTTPTTRRREPFSWNTIS